MNYEQIESNLSALGWKKYPSQGTHHKELWAKRFPKAIRCACNNDKEGIQVCVKVYAPFNQDADWSFEIELVGEKKDGKWANLSVYSLRGHELFASLDSQCNQLLLAWNTIAEL